MYSINIVDLEMVPKIPKLYMIAPVCPHRDTVTVEKGRIDGIALVIECGDEQASAIVEWLHTMVKTPRPVRCYKRGSRGGWSKVRPPKKEGR